MKKSKSHRPDLSTPNNNALAKAQASAQLSPQAQQNVKVQIKEILKQSREF
jgi:hypothetical protein